eukprot:TRINITY_DN4759_c0_g1_i10.p1 TRINITY_DN4759_c0_g1~~TRINITY_DN4759_c0_g1_i10.p1  ORF type:complete len:789 (+),score=106.44 TRINITY_DN4759_c0_g1_i10:122-2488(+)
MNDEGDNLQIRFQKAFLSWNYVDMYKQSISGLSMVEDLRVLPETFQTIEEYKRDFEKQLIEECAAQILHGSPERIAEAHPAVASGIESKGDFFHVKMKTNPEHFKMYRLDDLILVSQSNPSVEDPVLHALAQVVSQQEDQYLVLRLCLRETAQVDSEEEKIRARNMQNLLSQQNSCWWLFRLCSLVTILREWNALQKMHLIKPLKQILYGHQKRRKNQQVGNGWKFDKLPEPMKEKLLQVLNASQVEALEAAMGTEELVLIQGPPGTGKTSTILGLLAIVLSKDKSQKAIQHSPETQTENQVLQNWYGQCPWLTGTNPRDLVDPMATDDDVDEDCFGLLNGQQIPPVVIGRETLKRSSVLVCAPSNSALDEVLMRVLEGGLVNEQGQIWKPNLLRVGQKKTGALTQVHLDHVVALKMQQGNQSISLQEINSRRFERGRLRQVVIEEADIVFSTLSYCGSGVFARLTKKFDIVIIDEAAQAVEPSILVPLVLGCKKVILVGDPVQLPATVISARAAQYGYDQSLFKRLYVLGFPSQMLRIQYRMHPAISSFPAQQFYYGMLEDGPRVIEDHSRPWYEYKCFGPIAFFDVCSIEQLPPNGVSILNVKEAKFIMCLFKEMLAKFPNMKQTTSVAFITPYRAQVEYLRRTLEEQFGSEITRWVDVNSIDGFQGREKDLVIFSAVRGGQRHSIGFVADERRLNVAVTRSRSSLLIVGNVQTLLTDENWKLLVRNTRARRCMYKVQDPYEAYVKDLVSGIMKPVEPTEEDIRSQHSRDYIPRMDVEDQPMDFNM